MLVLTRQRNESIIIGDDIEIIIVDVRGDKVRLGITAPIEIPVHRKEVYEAIKREKEEIEEHPFSEEIWSKAKKIAEKYHIIIKQNDNLGFVSNIMELPNVYIDNKNMCKCFKKTQEALIYIVAIMFKKGIEPPKAIDTEI